MTFYLTLAYPQWQGSGRYQNLPRGAAATATVCARYAPMLHVPVAENLSDDAEGVRQWAAIFAQFRSAQNLLASSGARRVLTAGGDCAVDVAVIDYLNGKHPGLNVIWIDAQLDANTPQTSPSGNFHGMPVSAILGYAPEAMQAFLGKPVDATRFHYVGTCVGDDGEWALQRALNLQQLDLSNPDAALPFTGPVHIHFDLDALDPREFPYVAYPEGKLAVDDALALVRRIAREADLVGLTITEFAPADDAEVRAGSAIIARICEAVVGR